MEEEWELAVVNFYLWLGKRRTASLEKKGKLKRRHASEVDLEAQEKIYSNDVKECKYLLAGAAAALFFVLEAYSINLSDANLDANVVLFPFLIAFLMAAVGYWNSYKMDELFFPIKYLAKEEELSDDQANDLDELTTQVFGRNYIISRSIFFSAVSFILGIVLVVLTVLRSSISTLVGAS